MAKGKVVPAGKKGFAIYDNNGKFLGYVSDMANDMSVKKKKTTKTKKK